MKKILYLSMIAFFGQLSMTAHAASCVSVKQVGANYADKTVTFELTWSGCNGTTHLNTAWCFIDWRTVDDADNKGSWTRAAVSGTPVVTGASLGGVETSGFGVTGTSSATVTVGLDDVSDMFDWCAFATDYPPTATRNNGVGAYTLKGTPPFTVNGVKLGDTQNTYANGCITSITDATNNPNGFASGNYTTNDGTCKSCGVAYMQLRNHCGVVTNSRYNTYSNSGCTAGCAPPGSTNWTSCSGFSYISNVSYENDTTMNWSTANNYCANKGMRLPTRKELECMCSNKASLPGGYALSRYWSSSANGSSYYYRMGFTSGGCTMLNSIPSSHHYVKCVK